MFLKRTVNFILVFILLFADSGMTLYAHTCLKTKHTHYSIGAPKHCCKQEQDTKSVLLKKSSCCDVSSKYLKQNFVYKQTEALKHALPVAIVLHSLVFEIPFTQKVLIFPAANAPPLLSKADEVFTQTFRI